MPVRGIISKITLRYDFRPVLCPCQNGELVERASRWGIKYRAWFIISIIKSFESSSPPKPTWTCIPKMSSPLATRCISSSSSLYRTPSVIDCSDHLAKGWVEAAAISSPFLWAISTTSRRSRMTSCRTSLTFRHTWLPTSTCDCINSGFKLSLVGRVSSCDRNSLI